MTIAISRSYLRITTSDIRNIPTIGPYRLYLMQTEVALNVHFSISHIKALIFSSIPFSQHLKFEVYWIPLTGPLFIITCIFWLITGGLNIYYKIRRYFWDCLYRTSMVASIASNIWLSYSMGCNPWQVPSCLIWRHGGRSRSIQANKFDVVGDKGQDNTQNNGGLDYIFHEAYSSIFIRPVPPPPFIFNILSLKKQCLFFKEKKEYT